MCKLLLAFVLCLCYTIGLHAHSMDSIPNNGIPCPPVPPALTSLEEDSIDGRIPCPPKPPHLRSSKVDSIVSKDLAELIKQRWQQKIGQLNECISMMSDKTKSLETRNYYKERALNLFIAGGEPFEDEGFYNPGVKIEIISSPNKRPVRRLLKAYFAGLVNLRYSKVDIQPINVDDIEVLGYKKVDDNKYEVLTSIFQQSVVGVRDGKPIFGDKTTKKCKIQIITEKTIDGLDFIVLLGDVNALKIPDNR